MGTASSGVECCGSMKSQGLAGANEECGIVKGILLGTCMGLSCSEEEASPDE